MFLYPFNIMTPTYRVVRNAPLAQRNTLRVPARAATLIELADGARLAEVLALPDVSKHPLLTLGAGSNVLFTHDFDGVILNLTSRAMRVMDETGAGVRVRAEAGMEWDGFVRWTLAQGLCGLENLALIPGTVGAAPIQNIGAYGVELAQCVHCVEAFDCEQGNMRHMTRDECGFHYRNSVFKQQPGRWIVTAVEFLLQREAPLKLDYAGVRQELAVMQVTTPTAQDVAEAVSRLRRRKLPDPAVIGNAGSFFKNPIIPHDAATRLQQEHADLPTFDAPDGRKLSAAWLIEQCGWKGFRDGDAGVSEKHALVLVNHGAASGAQIWSLAERIMDSVQEKFAIRLEPEPKIV